MEPHGEPKRKKATLPLPSNAVILEYPNGVTRIETPPPTPQVLAEYEEAIAADPMDAKLRIFYSYALGSVDRRAEAIAQLREAVSIAPDDPDGHSSLAEALKQSGEMDASIAEFEEALRLLAAIGTTEQPEALTRWGLSTALRLKGKKTEAGEQLKRAVQLQEQAVKHHRGSEQLLQLLHGKLAEYYRPLRPQRAKSSGVRRHVRGSDDEGG